MQVMFFSRYLCAFFSEESVRDNSVLKVLLSIFCVGCQSFILRQSLAPELNSINHRVSEKVNAATSFLVQVSITIIIQNGLTGHCFK